MSSAVAIVDAAEFTHLTEKASEFGRSRAVPTNFELCIGMFRGLTDLARKWDGLDPARRAVLSNLASTLSEMSTKRTSFFRRQVAAFHTFRMVARIGWEELARQSSEFVSAKDEFVDTVFAQVERTNAELQVSIGNGISSALSGSREVLKRGQVGEWLKRIPP